MASPERFLAGRDVLLNSHVLVPEANDLDRATVFHTDGRLLWAFGGFERFV